MDECVFRWSDCQRKQFYEIIIMAGRIWVLLYSNLLNNLSEFHIWNINRINFTVSANYLKSWFFRIWNFVWTILFDDLLRYVEFSKINGVWTCDAFVCPNKKSGAKPLNLSKSNVPKLKQSIWTITETRF